MIADKIGHALRDNYPSEMIAGAKKFMKAHGFKFNGKEVTLDKVTECDILPKTTHSSPYVFDNFGNAVPLQERNEGFLHQRQEEPSTALAVHSTAFAPSDVLLPSSCYSSWPVVTPPVRSRPKNRRACDLTASLTTTAPSLQHFLSSRNEWNAVPAYDLFALGVPMDGRDIEQSLQALKDFTNGCGSEIEVGLKSLALEQSFRIDEDNEDDDEFINEINSLPLSGNDDNSLSDFLISCLQRAVDI